MNAQALQASALVYAGALNERASLQGHSCQTQFHESFDRGDGGIGVMVKKRGKMLDISDVGRRARQKEKCAVPVEGTCRTEGTQALPCLCSEGPRRSSELTRT